MANMEFHKPNYINTTTIIAVDAGNTGTAEFLIDKNTKLGFISSGYDSTTSTVITVEFQAIRKISHVFIQNHNLKSFRVFYNSATANSLLSTTTNSATSTYLEFSTISVQSISLQMDSTINGSEEKQVGEFVVTERQYVFERNPPIQSFKYKKDRKQIRHVMPDGGISLFNIQNKYNTKLKLEYFSQTSINTLFSIYDEGNPVYFVPEPTTTGWLGEAFPCVWSGDFDFRYAENSKSVGYSGTINLEEESST